MCSLNQNFSYVIRHVPSCHAMQAGKGEGELKKNQEMGTLPSFHKPKTGAPERNKYLELLTLLPYHIPTQMGIHISARGSHVIKHRDRFLAS